MTALEKDINLVPFLFMGCWNLDDTPRTSVAKAIQKNPIQTLILGGDNVYPEKVQIGNSTDFTKVYSMKTLMNGIHMLDGKIIYAALGNHNVSDPILSTQLGLTEWNMPSRYYSVTFNDYGLIILDSNLINTSEYDTMIMWLLDQVGFYKSIGKAYYYVQHDPFISFKKKKKTVLANGGEILKVLLQYPPIMILCADTHNYQKGKLQIDDITIPQIIVGTGGASPDFVTAKNGDSYEADGIVYTMEEYIPGYGYLEVSSIGTKFIKVESWRSFEGQGGRRTRTLKYYKNKKKQKTHKHKN